MFYLSRRDQRSSSAELRVADVATGAQRERLSRASRRELRPVARWKAVVFSTRPAQIWIAPLDRSAPPRQLATGADQPSFRSATEIVVRQLSGATNTLATLTVDQGRLVPFGDLSSRNLGYLLTANGCLPRPIRLPATTRPRWGRSRFHSTAGPRDDSAEGIASPAGRTTGAPSILCGRWALLPTRPCLGHWLRVNPSPTCPQMTWRRTSHEARLVQAQSGTRSSLRAVHSDLRVRPGDSERNLFRIPVH